MFDEHEEQQPAPERMTKAEFVLGLSELSRAEAAKRATEAGYECTPDQVSKIRWNAANPGRSGAASQRPGAFKRQPPENSMASLIRQYPIDYPVGEVVKALRGAGYKKKTVQQLKSSVWTTRFNDRQQARANLYAKAPPSGAVAGPVPPATRRGRPPNASRPAMPPGAGSIPSLSSLSEDETRLAQMILGMGIRNAARVFDVVQQYVANAFKGA